MTDDEIIENFIEILNNENRVHVKASELNYNMDCDSKFLEKLKALESYGLITMKNTSSDNPHLTLTFEGTYYGRKYINNYSEIYNKVLNLINSYSYKTSKEISEKLNIHQVIISAIFIDLSEQRLITYELGIGGMVIRTTNE